MQAGQHSAIWRPLGSQVSRVLSRDSRWSPAIDRRDPDSAWPPRSPHMVRHALPVWGDRREPHALVSRKCGGPGHNAVPSFGLTVDTHLRSATLVRDVHKFRGPGDPRGCVFIGRRGEQISHRRAGKGYLCQIDIGAAGCKRHLRSIWGDAGARLRHQAHRYWSRAAGASVREPESASQSRAGKHDRYRMLAVRHPGKLGRRVTRGWRENQLSRLRCAPVGIGQYPSGRLKLGVDA